MDIKCISCKREVTNDKGAVSFHCPSCSKGKVMRCRHCRSIAAPYKCNECAFVGP